MERLAAAGYGNLKTARRSSRQGAKSFGMTFPGGTHDMWLRYWMKAGGLDPTTDGIEITPIPPPDMFNNLSQENVRGYCVGEPWNAGAVAKDKGFTTIATQDLWLNHPEKALVVNETFATDKRDVLADVMKATSRGVPVVRRPGQRRAEAAKIIGVEKYVNATPAEIEGRLGGTYDLGAGLGAKEFGDDRMRFFRDGQVNLPAPVHAIWFMAQYVRFGYLRTLPGDQGARRQAHPAADLYAGGRLLDGNHRPGRRHDAVRGEARHNTFDPTQARDRGGPVMSATVSWRRASVDTTGTGVDTGRADPTAHRDARGSAPAPPASHRVRDVAGELAVGRSPGFAVLGVVWQFAAWRAPMLPGPLSTLSTSCGPAGRSPSRPTARPARASASSCSTRSCGCSRASPWPPWSASRSAS